jgi:TetR/AcrR family transcriptional regulator, transcriptional repressor for nem operon
VTTRDRLVESARQLLWERGYGATSPRAVLERSGVGQGSLYHHFRGKAELAIAAIDRTALELTETADRYLDPEGPGTAVERLTAWLGRERDVLAGCPIGRLTADRDVVADDRLRRPVERTLAAVRGRVAQVLAQGQERGELPADLDVEDVAATMVAVLQGGYVLARAAGSPEPFHRAARGALDLLARAAG